MSAQLASASPVPAPECVVMKVLGMRTVLGVAKSHENQREAAATQRRVDGVLVDDGLAREVDENRARLEEPQLVSADHAHGVGLGEGACRVR